MKRQERRWGGPCEAQLAKNRGFRTRSKILSATSKFPSEAATTLYPDNPPVSDNQPSKWVTPLVSGTDSCLPLATQRGPTALLDAPDADAVKNRAGTRYAFSRDFKKKASPPLDFSNLDGPKN